MSEEYWLGQSYRKYDYPHDEVSTLFQAQFFDTTVESLPKYHINKILYKREEDGSFTPVIIWATIR